MTMPSTGDIGHDSMLLRREMEGRQRAGRIQTHVRMPIWNLQTVPSGMS